MNSMEDISNTFEMEAETSFNTSPSNSSLSGSGQLTSLRPQSSPDSGVYVPDRFARKSALSRTPRLSENRNKSRVTFSDSLTFSDDHVTEISGGLDDPVPPQSPHVYIEMSSLGLPDLKPSTAEDNSEHYVEMTSLQADDVKESVNIGVSTETSSVSTDKATQPIKAQSVLKGKSILRLTIYANAGMITVHLLQARHLQANNPLCNTQIRVSLLPEGAQMPAFATDVVPDTNHPVFEEKFSFELLPEDFHRRLYISLWHCDITGGSENIGGMSFGIRHIYTNKRQVDGWYYLLEESIGKRKHVQAIGKRQNEKSYTEKSSRTPELMHKQIDDKYARKSNNMYLKNTNQMKNDFSMSPRRPRHIFPDPLITSTPCKPPRQTYQSPKDLVDNPDETYWSNYGPIDRPSNQRIPSHESRLKNKMDSMSIDINKTHYSAQSNSRCRQLTYKQENGIYDLPKPTYINPCGSGEPKWLKHNSYPESPNTSRGVQAHSGSLNQSGAPYRNQPLSNHPGVRDSHVYTDALSGRPMCPKDTTPMENCTSTSPGVISQAIRQCVTEALNSKQFLGSDHNPISSDHGYSPSDMEGYFDNCQTHDEHPAGQDTSSSSLEIQEHSYLSVILDGTLVAEPDKSKWSEYHPSSSEEQRCTQISRSEKACHILSPTNSEKEYTAAISEACRSRLFNFNVVFKRDVQIPGDQVNFATYERSRFASVRSLSQNFEDTMCALPYGAFTTVVETTDDLNNNSYFNCDNGLNHITYENLNCAVLRNGYQDNLDYQIPTKSRYNVCRAERKYLLGRYDSVKYKSNSNQVAQMIESKANHQLKSCCSNNVYGDSSKGIKRHRESCDISMRISDQRANPYHQHKKPKLLPGSADKPDAVSYLNDDSTNVTQNTTHTKRNMNFFKRRLNKCKKNYKKQFSDKENVAPFAPFASSKLVDKIKGLKFNIPKSLSFMKKSK